MTSHIESMQRSVEYRQQLIAKDIDAARRSDAMMRVRVRTGVLLIRLGEKLERGAASMSATSPSTTAQPRRNPASA